MKNKHKFLVVLIGILFFSGNKVLAISPQELIDNANRDLENFHRQVLADVQRRINDANARNQREVNEFQERVINEHKANNQRLADELQTQINNEQEELKKFLNKCNARADFIKNDLLGKRTALREKVTCFKEKADRQTLGDNSQIKQLEQKLNAQVEDKSKALAAKIDLSKFAQELNNPLFSQTFSNICNTRLGGISDSLTYQIVLKSLENRAAQNGPQVD